jgi:hypothetical protein
MDIYRKIAILIIVILFSYILYRLFKKRVDIMNQSIEGFTPTDSYVLTIQKSNKLNVNIQNMPKNYYTKPLNKFYIMGAYGGGFDGANISADMLLYTLSLGYRYMAINVFYDVVNNPNAEIHLTTPVAMVGFSSLYNPMENIAGHTMALSDFLELVQQNAFSTNSPNPGDPFFLHILPGYKTGTSGTGGSDTNSSKMANKGYNTQLNSQIEQALSLIRDTNRASGQITEKTPLSSILGQIVVVMDGDSTAGNMTTNLQNMIGLNIPSSSLLMAASFQEAKPKESGFNIVLPFGENGSILNSIPPYTTLYDKHKINVTAVCPWETRFVFTTSILGPSNLGDYENMFYNEGSTAFRGLRPLDDPR